MSKYPARDIERALQDKGFKLDLKSERFFVLFVNGQKMGIRTFISHGERDVSENLFSLMARQLHLTKAELRDLVECTLSGERYVELMRGRGFIG